MKIKKIMYVALILSFSTLTILSCKKTGTSLSSSGEWIAKINKDVITVDMLDAFYYAQQKSIYNESKEEIDKLATDPESVAKNPTLNKVEFLENFIRQRLVYNKAVDDGIMDNEEVKAHIEMAKEAVVVAQYVKSKFKDEIAVTDEDIEQMYSRNRGKFQGVPIEQAEQYISQQLFQQKLQMKLRDLVESLKEQSIIEKNTALLQGVKEEKKEEEKKVEEKKESKK